MDYGIQLYMSKRDGKDKIEDSPKKACSCWFVRRNRLATSGANLYFFVCFVLFRFRLFLLSLSPWPFVQSFFDMHAAPTATRS